MNVHYATFIAPKFKARRLNARFRRQFAAEAKERARAAKDSAQSQGQPDEPTIAHRYEVARRQRIDEAIWNPSPRELEMLAAQHGTTEGRLHSDPNDSTQDGTDEA